MQNRNTAEVELLAPAGNFEKLEIAIHYGADAVYLGGEDFSLRSSSGNFSVEELDPAVRLAHGSNVRVYLALNVYPRNSELTAISAYLDRIGSSGIDALIIADPGIAMTAKERVPHIPIHLSTQANTTNINSVLFWQKLGVKRINVARELSLEEIREIALGCDVEIEAFAHGAMCIAYSGRCLLSSYMTHRDSNRGDCAHSCRWRYALVEELRPGQYMPIAEDHRGTYILSSRDLCMVDHIGDMIGAGITSLKIEGRMKGINYLSTAVKVYREAIDDYRAGKERADRKALWHRALSQVNHRGYSTGFYFGDPDQVMANYDRPKSIAESRLVGKIIGRIGPGEITVDVRNRTARGDTVEIHRPGRPSARATIDGIIGMDGANTPVAHPGTQVTLRMACECEPNDLIREPSGRS